MSKQSHKIRNLSVLDLERNHDEFVMELYEGLKEYGFVVLRDHGISTELLSEAYTQIRQLFDLPLDTKMKYDSGVGGARGYTAFGRESAKGNPHADLKEFWHVGQLVDNSSPYFDTYPENIWPQELPQFQQCFTTIYKQLEELGKNMLRAIGEALGLEQKFFDEMVKDGNSIYRLLHYPAVKGMDTSNSMRAAAHADINLLTLLFGATDSGLELLDSDGNWMSVESNENEIVLDTGDMMSRLTNDVLPSTVHRVVNPNTQDKSRYSMPFFLHPHSKASLECLSQCTSDTPAKYSPITAGEFLQQRLEEIGLMK